MIINDSKLSSQLKTSNGSIHLCFQWTALFNEKQDFMNFITVKWVRAVKMQFKSFLCFEKRGSESRSMKYKGDGIDPALPTIWLYMICRRGYFMSKRVFKVLFFNLLKVVFTEPYLKKNNFLYYKKYAYIAKI